MYVTHGPSSVDVGATPMNDGLARSFGMWFSVMRGNLHLVDLARLRRSYPAYYWASLKATIQDFDSTFPHPGSDDELLFFANVVDLHPGPSSQIYASYFRAEI